MKETTFVIGDTHYGYNYADYSHPQERTRAAEIATDIFAQIVQYTQNIRAVVHLGDATEDLYPTRQYDPRLAIAQAVPLANVLRRRGIPLVQLAGDDDAYYDPQKQQKIRDHSDVPVGENAAEWAVRSLWSDSRKEIDLLLPGLVYRDDLRAKEDFSLFTHGHWLDDMPDDPLLLTGIKLNSPSPDMLRHLRSIEADHQEDAPLYEAGTRALAYTPGPLRRALDRALEWHMIWKQSEALEDQYEDSTANLFVAGHTHAPVIDTLPMGVYLNPGTLTSAFKIDTAHPLCTYAEIVYEDGKKAVFLHQIDVNTGFCSPLSHKECPIQ